jgi:hypothetical protein
VPCEPFESREDIVGSCYQVMTSEDVAVVFYVCRFPIALQLFVVMTYKCSINPITNPSPVSSH